MHKYFSRCSFKKCMNEIHEVSRKADLYSQPFCAFKLIFDGRLVKPKNLILNGTGCE